MKKHLICILSVWLLTTCSHPVNNPEKTEEWPEIYPDYIGVTIPATIAPMNFDYIGGKHDRIDVIVTGSKFGEIHVNARTASFPEDEWHKLLESNKGDSLLFTVSVKNENKWKQYRPFSMYVSDAPIDYGVVYRKVIPGYEVYSKMGIYERNLSSFEERVLLENAMVPGMCLNCHAFNRTNPGHLSLHIRGQHGATLMQIEGNRELLDTKTDSTLSACVYPYWHPEGKYIAYSVNRTTQSFHTAKVERIEVMDMASDILVYQPETHELLLSPLLQKKEVFETFPAFSADGKKLYFCSAAGKPMPEKYDEQDGTMHAIEEANSTNTESYHSWSSNSRWFIFSSRRDDGLYTRLYLAYIEPDGRVCKPFMLPQEKPLEYYDRLIYSYNVPEFTNKPIQPEPRKIENEIVSNKRVKVKIRK